jgi:rRNA maturation RNase YbeY
MAVSFFNADISFRLSQKLLLKKFIQESFLAETKKQLSLTYIFCSDDYLLKVNQDFLQHDYYTDIITFPLEETDKKVEAEIYISIDRVQENASKLKTSFEQELHRVIFHGVLHLAGYRDKSSAEKKQMRKMEDSWLVLYSSCRNKK